MGSASHQHIGKTVDIVSNEPTPGSKLLQIRQNKYKFKHLIPKGIGANRGNVSKVEESGVYFHSISKDKPSRAAQREKSMQQQIQEALKEKRRKKKKQETKESVIKLTPLEKAIKKYHKGKNKNKNKNEPNHLGTSLNEQLQESTNYTSHRAIEVNKKSNGD